MEVPERPVQSLSTSNSEPNSITSINNQQSSTEYAVPSIRQHSQQQQQLLLVNKNNTQINYFFDDIITICIIDSKKLKVI